MKFKEYAESGGYFNNLYAKLNQNKSNIDLLGLYGVKRFAVPVLGEKNLEEFQIGDLLTVYNRMRWSGQKEQSVLRVHKALLGILGDAEKEKIVAENPGVYIHLPAPSEIAERVYSPEEMRAFFSFADVSRHRNIYRFMAYSGLSVTETLGLSVGDIDWQTGMVHVQKIVYEPLGRVILKWIFAENRMREFSLNKKAIHVLLDELELRDERQFRNMKNWDNNMNLIFCRENGSPISPRRIRREGWYHMADRVWDFDVMKVHRQFQYGCYEDIA